MSPRFVVFTNVFHRHDSAPQMLLERLTFSIPAGWTGVVGVNGAGKTTLLKLACGLENPTGGRVQQPGGAVYCAQRTDSPPDRFDEMLEAGDRPAAELIDRLGIGPDWPRRWNTLSHGERKRAQIAVALWQDPEVLALDEPTNHIDDEARALLILALRTYRGIGLLVSHDRELLDALCERCIFIDQPAAVMRPGGYSSGRREALREEESARIEKELAKRELVRLKREASRRAAEAARSAYKRSKRNLAPKDHDGRSRIDAAVLSGADGSAGKLARRMQARVEGAQGLASGIRIKKEYELGIWIAGERSRRATLFHLPEGAIPLGGGRALDHPALTMRPEDRIALTGPNGSGKSTLIRTIINALELTPERLTYLPQEIDIASSRHILDEARRQPSDVLGKIMSAVSRLGSRPAALLESDEPTPGETRKLLLALGIALSPHLIILDEPTNHLDLPSIECLEEALADCPCGLLLASHDQRFLERLTRIRWRIEPLHTGAQDRMSLSVVR